MYLQLASMHDVAAALDLLGPVHLDASARYPNNRPICELANVADETAHAVIAAVTQRIRV
jgi:hypothetical protein